jgi:hypothetical protein
VRKILPILLMTVLLISGCSADDPITDDIYSSADIYANDIYTGDIYADEVYVDGVPLSDSVWTGSTANNAPTELCCLTIRAKSALAFAMKIVASNNTADEVAMFTVSDGLIIRDSANNTTLVSGTVVTVYEDDASWDVAIAADDINEALIIIVTGDAVNTVQWAVVMDKVETDS